MNEHIQNYADVPVNQLHTVAEKLFLNNNVPTNFSTNLSDLKEEEVISVPCLNRVDLRMTPCITIDCDDTKDMDDAVSLIVTEGGYTLGVHIADVATYITPGSVLDIEALNRGTSIYLPHMTIPMLPPILSDNLCSLNPNLDRCTISVLIDMDQAANVEKTTITKSLICSRLKGTYSEVNSILNHESNLETTNKYASANVNLFEMQKLAEMLRKAREKKGAKLSDNNEPKINIVDGEIVLEPWHRGIAEGIIEEFMVLTNRLVAEYFLENKMLSIFRVQEEKNTLANYTTDQCHHADLALEHYVHFTSPIRRLADLKIHQVLTAHLDGMSSEEIHSTFAKKLEVAAEKARTRKRRADSIQLACKRYCYRSFFNTHRDEYFTGKIVGQNQTRNCPIIELNDYHIRILGAAAVKAYDGEQVSFKVEVNEDRQMYRAIRIEKLPAIAC